VPYPQRLRLPATKRIQRLARPISKRHVLRPAPAPGRLRARCPLWNLLPPPQRHPLHRRAAATVCHHHRRRLAARALQQATRAAVPATLTLRPAPRAWPSRPRRARMHSTNRLALLHARRPRQGMMRCCKWSSVALRGHSLHSRSGASVWDSIPSPRRVPPRRRRSSPRRKPIRALRTLL